jgi:hypothetical protein
MLFLAFPSSIVAYLAALQMFSLLEPSADLLSNKGPLLFSVWWLIFFIFGLSQWFIIRFAVRRFKPDWGDYEQRLANIFLVYGRRYGNLHANAGGNK